MEKFLAVFLSLYIALIACYPCSDKDPCADEKKPQLEVSIANDAHSPVELDLCSPFCICSCCSTHANAPKSFQFSDLTPALVAPLSHIKPQSIKSMPGTIWQPPKIA